MGTESRYLLALVFLIFQSNLASLFLNQKDFQNFCKSASFADCWQSSMCYYKSCWTRTYCFTVIFTICSVIFTICVNKRSTTFWEFSKILHRLTRLSPRRSSARLSVVRDSAQLDLALTRTALSFTLRWPKISRQKLYKLYIQQFLFTSSVVRNF